MKYNQSELWKRTLEKELTRRKRVLAEKGPKVYMKLFAANNKGLGEPKDCPCVKEHGRHVFVPAAGWLWIHDGIARSHGTKLYGFERRAFKEALPFKLNGYLVIPQVCWACSANREQLFPILSADQKKTLAREIVYDREHKKNTGGAKQNRGRKGQGATLDDFEAMDLLDI